MRAQMGIGSSTLVTTPKAQFCNCTSIVGIDPSTADATDDTASCCKPRFKIDLAAIINSSAMRRKFSSVQEKNSG